MMIICPRANTLAPSTPVTVLSYPNRQMKNHSSARVVTTASKCESLSLNAGRCSRFIDYIVLALLCILVVLDDKNVVHSLGCAIWQKWRFSGGFKRVLKISLIVCDMLSGREGAMEGRRVSCARGGRNAVFAP